MRGSASLSPSEHVTGTDFFRSCYKDNNPDHQNGSGHNLLQGYQEISLMDVRKKKELTNKSGQR